MPFISGTKMKSMTDLIERQADTIKELENRIETLTMSKAESISAKKVKKDNSFDTKIKAVKEHLISLGNITSWEAIQSYNATRLSAIIFELKKRGMNITTTRESNDKSNYVRYHYSESTLN